MTLQSPAPAYSPYGLLTDPAALGLSETTVRAPIGTAVARYRRTAATPRATIFLHGAAGSWTTWTPLLQDAAARGIPINNPVLVDLPGFGSGTLTGTSGEVTLEAVCEIVRHCAEELGYTEWDIVGHSMGGFVALHMAAIWPQSVLSVGVVSGTGESIISSIEHPVRNFRTLPAFTLLWKAMVLLAPFGPLVSLLVRGIRALGGMRTLVRPLFRYPARIDRSIADALGADLHPRSFVLAAGLVRGYDPETSWARIDCAVRALNGDSDAFSTAADLRRLGAIVAGSELAVIADCGHFAAAERPTEVLYALGFAARATA